jgi:hypothetical protein
MSPIITKASERAYQFMSPHVDDPENLWQFFTAIEAEARESTTSTDTLRTAAQGVMAWFDDPVHGPHVWGQPDAVAALRAALEHTL